MIELLVAQIPADSPLSFLRVFSYITVRAALALLTAFVLSVLWGPRVIDFLRRLKVGQNIRTFTSSEAVHLTDNHQGKQGTPTMGGLLMILTLMAAVLLFGKVGEPVLWLAVAMMLGFGGIGFIDDYRKVRGGKNEGLTAKQKLGGQVILGLAFALLYGWVFQDLVSYKVSGEGAAVVSADGSAFLLFPFFKTMVFGLGILYIPFAILVLTATSNAVNLTDGLDGLATGVTISAAICFAVVAYLAGRIDMSEYLLIPRVVGAGELAVLLAALIGSCFGFLWFNSFPAQVFMGDVGSMMLGGVLGAVALLIKQEFLLLIVGGIFVAEALSVILQVGSFKLRGKRIFLMSPLHHHFEKLGIPESKIIARFWIVSALLALAGLSTLKFR